MAPKYLRRDAKQSARFSAIAQTNVDVYFNNRWKRWELWYKGNEIIGLLDSGLNLAPAGVRRHFSDLRNRVGHKRLAEFKKRDLDKEERENDERIANEYWKDSSTIRELERAARNPVTIN